MAEYWVVDPIKRSVMVYRRAGDGSFPRAESLPDDADAITTPLLPAFALSIQKMFRE